MELRLTWGTRFFGCTKFGAGFAQHGV